MSPRRWRVTRTWEVEADTAVEAMQATMYADGYELSATEVLPGEDVATASWMTGGEDHRPRRDDDYGSAAGQ